MSRWCLLCVGCIVLWAPSAFTYELPVHLSLTRWLCEQAGFSSEIALKIAQFDQGTDDDPSTTPMPRAGSLGADRRAAFHFVTPNRLADLRARASQAVPDREWQHVGQYLHALEDVNPHEGYGPVWGHASALHSPDKPWRNPTGFQRMVAQKFAVLVDFSKAAKPGDVIGKPADLKSKLALVDSWVVAEQRVPEGDRGGPARFATLEQRLYDSAHARLTGGSVNAYRAWKPATWGK